MIKASQEQREQISEFFTIIHDHYDDLLLYPCRDRKTHEVRLAVCVADREADIIYVKGLYFLPNDKFYDRFELIDPEDEVLTEMPAGIVKRFFRRLIEWWRVRKL